MLDLGCGNGVPVARELSARFAVTGVDLSPVQVERARALVPGARFVCADMTAVEFEPSLLRSHQACHQAKQGGFAHPIGAGHQQCLARANGKAQAAEDLAAPPDAGEVGPDEPHHLPPPGARRR